MTANDQAAKNGKPVNKSAFVRQFPDTVPPREVVAKAKEQGIEMSGNFVSALRSTLRARAAKKAGKPAAGAPTKRGPGRPRKAAAVPATSAASAPVKRGPGRPPKSVAAAATRASHAPPTGDTDRQFLSLVLELGLRRSEDLLASVKARATALA